MATRFHFRLTNSSRCNVSSIHRILGEMTTTGDIAPVMVGVSPVMMNRRRAQVNAIKPKGQKRARVKTAVESILGEDVDDDQPKEDSLIPDEAEVLKTASEIEDESNDTNVGTPLGPEDLLEPSLALVAPDTTPNAKRELDPSLVPDKDPALSTVLGESKSRIVGKTRSVGKTEEDGLPTGEMPRPAGEFINRAKILAEGEQEKPKFELVVGSSASPLGESAESGQLGAASMPPPRDPQLDKTMSAFRRFHHLKS
jgi:hypothetical protein